jgi:hypothetical protein
MEKFYVKKDDAAALFLVSQRGSLLKLKKILSKLEYEFFFFWGNINMIV